MYEIIIVGGGIAGLYTGYKLQKKGFKVLIIEKENDIGGRIKTCTNTSSILYECGASKILPSHVKMKKLIKELGFKKKQLICTKKTILYDIETINDDFMYEHIQDMVLRLKKEKKEFIVNMTLLEWMKKYYDELTISNIIHGSGYKHLFEYCNAYSSIQYLERDFINAMNIITFKPGLYSIIEKLKELFIYHGGRLLTGTIVKSISLSEKDIWNVHISSQIYYKCNKIIFAIPSNCLRKIKGLPNNIYQLCDNVIGIPLIRIFCESNMITIPYTHTNTVVQRTMSISPIFHQIVYASGHNAIWWNSIPNNKIKQKYSRFYPNVSSYNFYNIEKYFWPNGIHLWRKGYHNININETIFKDNIFIIGEAFNTYQRWMESAIESADKILSYFVKDNKYLDKCYA